MKKRYERNEQLTRKKEGNQDKLIRPTSKKVENQVKPVGLDKKKGNKKTTSEQLLEQHRNNNLNSPGCSTQTLQNNYDQRDDVICSSNNHSIYDFNSGIIAETSTVQNNSPQIKMWNKSTPAVTSNYSYYDSWNTNDTASSTYTQGLHTSEPAPDNFTHGHIPQFYNSHNHNYGHISYENPENVNLNNLKTLQDLSASQEIFFQKFQEKMHTFCETQEQNISNKINNMQNYFDKKIDELKTYFNTKLDNLQVNKNANNNDGAYPVYSLPEGFPLKNMQEFEEFEENKEKQGELRNYFIWWGNPNAKVALRQYLRYSISDELACQFKWAKKNNKESNDEEPENAENEPASHKTLYDTRLSKMMFQVINKFEKTSIESFNQLMQAALRVAKQRHRDRVRRENRERNGRRNHLQDMNNLYSN
ncbi:bromodomain-containing protein DDB_G0280777-like isoform X2 [Nylanderia fulva]|nr:bromodomain-containing protein DDB_G0280777-like isoform X2 [Nylanderia fulva]XP_029162356.1 bromodomain-containing protein DDB_G0280777-like isoform X2 [Nylanderia fulva]